VFSLSEGANVETISQLSWLEMFEGTEDSSSSFGQLLRLLEVSDTLPGWPDAFGLALREQASAAIKAPIRTLSLFSGGGGLDIAFHDAGFHIYQMVELEARYVETLALNALPGRRLEGAEPLCMDISAFEPPDGATVDFIIGGPPCQTFSAAGRRAAGVAGLDDPRGRLFQEYVRILKKLQPQGFLFENVYGIVGAQGGKPWKEIVQAFAEAGYTISARILDAADYGVPQHRERLIIVGMRAGSFQFPRPTHGPDSPDGRPYYTAGLAVEGIDERKPGPVGGRYGHLLRAIPPGLNYSFYTEEMGHPVPVFSWRSKFSDLLYKADPAAPVRTVKAQGGQYTGPFHWENRPFSIGELKRLQTFPDEYLLVGGRQVAIAQIGNSVPPQFGRMLALAVLMQVFGVTFPFQMDTLAPHEELGFRRRKALLTAHYKQKASEAIARQFSKQRSTAEAAPDMQTSAEDGISFLAYLGPDFLWRVQGDAPEAFPWNVACSIIRHQRCIDLFIRKPDAQPEDAAVVIEIAPVRRWLVPAEWIRLLIQSPSFWLFTAAWKALEYYLAREGIKADLVQLNRYYQYQPAIRLRLEHLDAAQLTADASHYWSVIRRVLEGIGVRQILPLERLAELWEAHLDTTIDALVMLRSLGYEVRSEHTNGQIPGGHVLIPYAFPTLNPLSVQLRKTLFPHISLSQQFGRER
jgi:DNA (cytosine-5)-methyltransferase 1